MNINETLCTALIFFFGFLQRSGAIDCFKCTSLNNNYPPCEDPFHNNYTEDILHSPCMGGRKGRDGLFPATACIKINGVFEDTQETIMIRTCALDSGTLTTDTELVRMSHCGGFHYSNRYVRGCVQSCDGDACNSSSNITPGVIHSALTVIVTFISHFVLFQTLITQD